MPAAPNRVVTRYVDGRLLKGFTFDFAPTRPAFHVTIMNAAPTEKPIEVSLAELKAVFFVKDFVGDSEYNDRKACQDTEKPAGRKVSVRFKDGEVIVGTTQGDDRTCPGFFLVPVDPNSNIDRCFVVGSTVTEVVLG